MTWLAGPPGAGKTTLVSGYLDVRQRPGIWYDTDAGDDDPATFFHYMDIAAQHAAPRIRRPLPAFTPEHRPGLAAFARRYFEALYARLKTPAVLVLDNFQEAATDGPFQLIVAAAAAALPPGVRLMVLSRHEPPPAFARLPANNLLTVVDDAALRFTLDESCAIAALRGKTELDRPTLERLHLAASGWAAGLVLLLERAALGAGAPARNEHQVLFDYFAAEIFFAFDTTTQRVLCQTALLPQANAALAQQLTGEPSAGRILADLYERNYFVLKQGHGAVYQFHPLFQAFLRHRAEAAWPLEQLNAVRTHAAQLLAADGDPEAAAERWRSAADWPALARQALKHAPVLAAQARFQPLSAAGRLLLAHWCALCRAHSALAAGDDTAAQTALCQAMGLSRDGHFFNFFWPRPLLARLCAQALTWQIDTPHVSEMIARLALSPADVSHAPEAWPWPVKLRALGRLVITLGGQPLGFSGKEPKKPLALLMALISFGGVQVSEQRLNAALWGGAEAEDAHTAFTAALHRLRKLLGSDDALLLTDNRLSLNADKVWLDVWALDRALTTPHAVPEVLALYQGAFLDDNEAPWALATREKLRAKFVRFATQQSHPCPVRRADG